MIPRLWPATAQRFVTLATEVANSLDFATVVREPGHPLGSRTETLRKLWWDLYAEGRRAGPSAIALFEACTAIIGELAVVTIAHDDGDLAPWLERRARVRELLDELHAAGPQDPRTCRDHDVVVRSSSVPSASARRECLQTIIDVRPDAGRKGEKGEKPRSAPCRPGRSRTPAEEGAPFRAAFWMHDATDLIPDDQRELRSAIEILGADPRPQEVFELLNRHGLTIMLSSVRNRVPSCWPKTPDGRHAPSWDFSDYAGELTADSFARNLRRHAREIQGAPDLDRHAPAARADFIATAAYTPASPHGPTPQVIRRRAIIAGAMDVEEALSRVNAAVLVNHNDPEAWDALRQTMVDRMRLPAGDVEELLAARDASTVDSVAALLMKTRRRAGDDGDCDPDGRPQ
jgi:hypothetical protein